VLHFDLSSVVRNMAGPSNPHAPAGAELAARHRRQARSRA
jgi:aconitate hydratase